MTGIEPAYSAWEADILPLNYIGIAWICPGEQLPASAYACANASDDRSETNSSYYTRHLRLSNKCQFSYTGCMLLSDRDLRAELDAQQLVIEPYEPSMVQPSSVDVRLDRLFRVFNNSKYTHIDPKQPQEDLTTLVEVEGDEPFILHPGEFVLGATLEKFTIPNHLAGRLEGKSSLGRLGLLTHSTAGFIDPGFSGHITLELSNTANLPIALYPEMKVGQLAIFQLSSPTSQPYGSGVLGSKYQGQRGPTPSRAYLNFRD